MEATLAGQQLPRWEDFFTGIQDFLREIQRSDLELIVHRIQRVQWVLDNNGDYFHEQTFYDHHSFQFFPDRPVATIYRTPITRMEIY
jgi:hypothetical protein